MKDDTFEKSYDEPLVMALEKDDPELLKCVEEAQKTLDTFLDLYEQYHAHMGVYFAIKVFIESGEDKAHLWYSFNGLQDNLLVGEHFEIPKSLEQFKVIKVKSSQVEDWMINDHEVLYGGFSLRYQRSKLPENQREKYDKYVGVSEYRDI